ncbi:MAG: Single-stranded DNA-binding protein [Candidatus Roizmanbacteria bacterium GW2011_GWA2_37_7]|uniref:Single-stranded DNA-binding protein n=1 Tax=Candidatus Roizmanbacteria bacterium GW2011_GWA2_37_7 TaxID=1618481 RepID=A0A0G0HF46_9BACT|nr:MAG: Single-stranded DNA-binding protein [Candidatus Roizmanbacteria bacterium GW2011_GWA2_37_7]
MSSRSINKVTLLGNLTRDPELKYTPNGTAVCTFGLATNRSWTTQEGKTREEAQYHRIVAWQKLAELCNKLLSKGRKAYLEGRITYRDYIDKSGQQRHITEIVLDDFIVFYDGKYAGDGAASEKKKDFSTEESSPAPDEENTDTKKSPEKKEAEKNDNEQSDEDVNPDDIPF